MIQKENNSSRKIKENKYKILRMSLLLGTDTDKEETITNFEDAAREIDSMNNETYLSELEPKFYDTKTLEEEKEKLTELVDYIAGRISQRDSLLSDYINVTGRNLNGLGEIKYENKLFEYQERLKYINEYLDNTRKIEEETNELQELKARLIEEEKQKEQNEIKNEELENLLFKKFKEIVSNKIDISNLNEENIDNTIASLYHKTEDSKKSLDIFTKSFETLKNAGISYEEEAEYKSYVVSARDLYYENKEEEYLLELYKLLLSNETEYMQIYNKRESINSLLKERLELRENLAIKETDCLNNIYNIIENQSKIVEGQKENIDNIANITSKIIYIEERIEELNEANQKVEILSLLKEYNIIDTYDEDIRVPEITPIAEENTDDNVEIPDLDLSFEIPEVEEEISLTEEIPTEVKPQEDIQEEPTEIKEEEEQEFELPINKPYKNNFVMGSHDPMGLDVEECIDKAKKVMKRVGKMLNIPLEEEQEEVKEAPIVEEMKEEERVIEPANPFVQPEEVKLEVPKVEENPFVNTELPQEEPKKEEVVNPFVEPQASIEEPIIEEQEIPKEESNVKNVLPSADSFWDTDIPSASDFDETLAVSNDDFFANSMNDFEFPNLDEFK